MSRAKSAFPAFIAQKISSLHNFLRIVLPNIQNNDRLSQAMHYSTLSGGKRIRPLLVYAVGEVLGVPDKKLNAAAASIELIHCYSLIHDDLPAMDDDDLRRGIASCHKAFDEATAILAGDALQSLAFEILSDPELNSVGFAKQTAMVMALARAIGARGMVLGQAQDLAAENCTLTLAELITLHKHKTGALFNVCVELALLSSEHYNNTELKQQLINYADNLGLAFQIQDDILDVVGDHNIIGKPLGSDLKFNKSTFTSLLGLETAQQHVQQHFDKVLQLAAEIDNGAILVDFANYLMNRDH